MTFPDLLLIGGDMVPGADRRDIVNPATGVAFAVAPRADARQLNAAVAAARRAAPGWAALGYDGRRSCLEDLADSMEANLEGFAHLLTLEQGKPLAQARMETMGAIGALRFHAQIDVAPVVLRDSPVELIVARRRPLGVVAAITPWNFPLYLLLTKIAPALSVGNTIVAKPAPTTPLTTLKLGELAAERLPAGVLNIIVDDNDLGQALTAHPDVDKVSFTGSGATGRRVMANAASSLKRLTLELGGNDAAIVLDDVEPEEVAPRIFQSAMINAGQVCLATKRVYAPARLYDRLCAAIADLAERTVVDDGLRAGAEMGPVQNAIQFAKLESLLEEVRGQGRMIAGGSPLDREGFFVPPTIVRDIPDDAALVREEQFGPVLPVLAYEDLDEALRRANNTPYGLGGTLWTGDLERGLDVAARVESGTVWVNKHLDLPFDVPFGGIKQSGFGTDSHEEFTSLTIINAARP